MLQPRLLTVRAQPGLRRTHRIVRPALAAARFRMTTFWIWHDYSTGILNFRFVISDLQSRSPAPAEIRNQKSKTANSSIPPNANRRLSLHTDNCPYSDQSRKSGTALGSLHDTKSGRASPAESLPEPGRSVQSPRRQRPTDSSLPPAIHAALRR